MDDNSEYEYYLSYYTEQSGGGLEHYQGRRYVPAGQEGGGLGDLFKAALPALTGLAKKAGKRVLSAGASVLKDAMFGRSFATSAKNRFRDAGHQVIDDGLGMVGVSSSNMNSHAQPPRKRAKTRKSSRRGRKRNIFG